MAATMATIRRMTFQNVRILQQHALAGTRSAGIGSNASLLNGAAIRSFGQTAARGTTNGSAARTKAPQQMHSTFFSSRNNSIAAPKSLLQQIRARLFHSSRARRNGPPSPNPTAQLNSPGGAAKTENLSLGQRMRKLSREYGWAALGVYLGLTAIDLPLCYLLVRWLGTDRIGRWEHIVVDYVKVFIPESVKQKWYEWRASMKKENPEVEHSVEMAGWGVEEAEVANKKDASLGTQLALAYAIHKSFIFIRVPLTAAITPNVVKILRGWGFEIGKRTTKATRVANAAEVAAKKAEKAAKKSAR